MMYPIKQPLIIVGAILIALFSLHIVANDKPVENKTSANSTQQSIVSTNNTNPLSESSLNALPNIKGLDLPENAQSTIIPTDKKTDIRVIIDISGSMKQNDPDNLRIPALNLIIEMLPNGSKAGVWTFGQWVNMLIRPEVVDKKWRENAKKQAQKINSHGLRTNIGDAMEQATWQFESSSEYEQHIILLTDGLVDIASDSDADKAEKNNKERERISTQVLKKYKDLGVNIHSIGLSNNADKVLLDKLALESGGSSVVVNTPEELVNAFLKAFEKSAPQAAEQVPLVDDNTFEIDASIEEFTALVFREKGTPGLQLVSPSGQVLSQIKSIPNARWFGESVYDLVTITEPEAGKWKIKSTVNPDNRVTVVSDLKMEIKELPNVLFPGQQVDFDVVLHEDGKIITDPDFLKLMTFEMTMTAESGRSGTKVISDPDNVPLDGRYKESISRLSEEGQYELKIAVDGKTFKRMRKEYIQVRQPIGFEIRKIIKGTIPGYAIRVIPQVAEIQVSKTRVIAKVKGPDQSSIIQAVPWLEEGVWQEIVIPDKGPGEYNVTLNIKGSIGEDETFRVKPEPIMLTFPIPDDFTHQYFSQSKEAPLEQVGEDIAQETQDEASNQQATAEPKGGDEKIKEDTNAELPVEDKQPEPKPELEPKVSEPDTPEIEQNELPAEEEPEANANEKEPEADEKDDEDKVLEPIPYWLYAVIPLSILLLSLGGYFVYHRIMSKKTTSIYKEEAPSASLNDGLDDEVFDEDFDLSGDDSGLDDMSISATDEQGEIPEDDIPDFDENFDIDNDKNTAEQAAPSDQTTNTSDIDDGLSNLESELDDIDVDALIDGDNDKK